MGLCSAGTAGASTTRRVRPATGDEVSAWLERTRSERRQLEVGELALARGVPFALDAGGFGRHTFLCGQSGSGKTYSLGVLLEQLLMETRLRVVVLDPNSDYVRLGEPRPGADARVRRSATARPLGRSPCAAERAATSRSASACAISARSTRRRCCVSTRWPTAASTRSCSALVEDENVASLEDLARSPAEALKLRAHNLGVDRWGIWPGPEGQSLPEELEGRRRRAASSWTSGRCRRARSRRSRPGRSWSGCGGGARGASRSRS